MIFCANLPVGTDKVRKRDAEIDNTFLKVVSKTVVFETRGHLAGVAWAQGKRPNRACI